MPLLRTSFFASTSLDMKLLVRRTSSIPFARVSSALLMRPLVYKGDACRALDREGSPFVLAVSLPLTTAVRRRSALPDVLLSLKSLRLLVYRRTPPDRQTSQAAPMGSAGGARGNGDWSLLARLAIRYVHVRGIVPIAPKRLRWTRGMSAHVPRAAARAALASGDVAYPSGPGPPDLAPTEPGRGARAFAPGVFQ